MGERDYPRPEDFEAMREMVDSAFYDNSAVEAQDDLENFYGRVAKEGAEEYQETVSEAGQVFSIAIFLRDEAQQRLIESDNKGLSEQSFLQEKISRLEKRLDVLNQLINPGDSNQSVEELIKIIRALHKTTKSEARIDGNNYKELLFTYEDVEGFLLQFKDPETISAYKKDNFSYRNWLESGEV